MVQTALGPTGFLLGRKRAGCKIEHSAARTEIQNEWMGNFIPPYTPSTRCQGQLNLTEVGKKGIRLVSMCCRIGENGCISEHISEIQIRQNSGNLIAQEIKASQEVPAFIMLDIY